MLRSRMMRAGLAATVLAALPLSSGCSASYSAESQVPYTPDQGVWVDSGPLELRNLLIVSETDGSGTLIGTIFHNGDSADRLTAVDVAGRPAGMEALPITLRPGPPTVLGVDTVLGDAVPTGLRSEQVKAGGVVRVTLDFEETADVSTNVFVVAREGAYSEVPVPERAPEAPPAGGRQAR